MRRLKTNKGITLIALIITIIVMLILVGVTITIAVNGGLFAHAQTAASETNNAIAKEQALGNGKINIAGQMYNSPQEYVDILTGKEPTETVCKTCGGDGFYSIVECWEGCGASPAKTTTIFCAGLTCLDEECGGSDIFRAKTEEDLEILISGKGCPNTDCDSAVIWDFWEARVCARCEGNIREYSLRCKDCDAAPELPDGV